MMRRWADSTFRAWRPWLLTVVVLGLLFSCQLLFRRWASPAFRAWQWWADFTFGAWWRADSTFRAWRQWLLTFLC
jgi:hypothetical protein